MGSEVTAVEIANMLRHPIYLDKPRVIDDNLRTPLIEDFKCEKCPNPWKIIFSDEVKEKVRVIINGLENEKQKFAVWYKFGLDGFGRIRNNIETAWAMYKEQGICSKIRENMPLTGADIYFHIEKAKKKLRKRFIIEGLEDYI